ncbi:DUF676-domain-containing protein [Metschnikowia bicuspidata var. bicuspidata NRRL YB-4993]|uniref:DUF676-domain-containing protein n=1 Tax=Metschnikowia bicuspidata var. bicuspidata NRRL YB-4993 TaxID=869754 RepID=A0A1A0HEB4_9ASCO|nr:DUF676-domain-containing protein [Metschnikowia bicuspidata var. bicuspidata NRRL YB-4993]OBA22242.1 DUF676-domain-containing protein [Metschnikowia bicuspidata var. bicuspidata NRRL YB-4993]
MIQADLESSSIEDENVHLFLFVHGLWGNPNHMLTIEKAVKRSVSPISSERIVTMKLSSFRFWKTYDGIQRCGESTIADLFYEIETLKLKNKSHVSKISIIGYSLGGLISRYVIGRLHELGFFEEVIPIFFCTFATPHVGIHFFKDTVFDKVANRMGKRLFGKTGFQLFLGDSETLLVKMTLPESHHVKGLRLFQKRILLANIKNDRTVPFYTSFITEYSPFDLLNSIKIQYFEVEPSAKVNNVTVWPKFVDLRRSSKITSKKSKHRNVQEATSILRSNIIFRYTLLVFAALVLFPFYLPLIICLSFYVSGYSVLKVRLINGPDIVEHWSSVKMSVFRGGLVDVNHAELGDTRRQERKKMSRHQSFKGDTSNLTENTMEKMLAAEERFTSDQADMIDEEKSSDEIDETVLAGSKLRDISIREPDEESADWVSFLDDSSNETNGLSTSCVEQQDRGLLQTSKKKELIEIPVLGYDQAIKNHAELLVWDSSESPSLFEDNVKLPLSENESTIVQNLNKLDWIKIPIYHDLFNAHDSIVARRGDMRNPKGTCTLFFWASILRNHIREEETK